MESSFSIMNGPRVGKVPDQVDGLFPGFHLWAWGLGFLLSYCSGIPLGFFSSACVKQPHLYLNCSSPQGKRKTGESRQFSWMHLTAGKASYELCLNPGVRMEVGLREWGGSCWRKLAVTVIVSVEVN